MLSEKASKGKITERSMDVERERRKTNKKGKERMMKRQLGVIEA